jgi:1,4-dihydroxy-2-naphthoate octaprenyltransferase
MGEHGARVLNRVAVVVMYVGTIVAIVWGALTPLALVAFAAWPRARRALRVMAAPAPDAPPAGYVGWPLWYHRVCLVHNRAFGWLYIAGLALGAIFPHLLMT